MLVYRITDRLEATDAGLGVVPCDPVWARDMTAPRYFELIHAAWMRGDRPLTPAETGCALAHLAVLERIAASGRHGLILEADMPLDADRLARVRALVASQPELDFVHMQGETKVPMRGRPRPDGLYLIDRGWDFSGGAAYLVSPQLAMRLAARQRKRLMRADDWIDLLRGDPALPLYWPLFGKMAPGSTIEAERQMLGPSRIVPLLKRRIANRLRRDWRRMREALGIVPPVLPRALDHATE